MDGGPTPRVLRGWQGRRMLVKYLTGPDITDPEDADRPATGPAQARTELLLLVEVGSHGVEVRKVAEGRPEFISWGAVLAIQDVLPTEPGDEAL